MFSDTLRRTDKKINLFFASSVGELLEDIRLYLEDSRLFTISIDISKEHNNFCALIVGEEKERY